MKNIVRERAIMLCGLAGACLLVLASTACRESGGGDAAPQNAGAAANNSSTAASDTTGEAVDPAKLDAEVARLEKQAEKNPGNAETLAELARAYVRRGNAHRAAQRMREAMADYRRAQQNDPDNDEAQKNAADIAPQVEGTPTGEYGEPAPLPISPNVTGSDEKPTPAPKNEKPTPAPKKP